MKLKKILLVLSVFVTIGNIPLFAQKGTGILLPKSINTFLEPIRWVDKGVYIVNPQIGIQLNEEDTNLMLKFDADTINLLPFYISQFEITNQEYREFVIWVRDSVIRSFLALRDDSYYSNIKKGILNWDKAIDWKNPDLKVFTSDTNTKNQLFHFDVKFSNYGIFMADNKLLITNVYPDTSAWIKEFPFAFMKPMTNNYFWHSAYNNYPVVGISYYQALAFCDWKTKKLKELFQNEKLAFPDGLQYRLPSEREWEYAALSNFSLDYDRIYPWQGTDLQKSREFMCNYGAVTDRNRVIIKRLEDDGALFTNTVNKYKPNENYLYNMSGNVSEWVISDAKTYLEYTNMFLFLKDSAQRMDSLNIVINYLQKMYGECYIQQRIYDKSFVELAGQYLNKIETVLTKDFCIAKGGSWADQPMYLLPSAFTITQNKNSSSCKTGFRIVLDTYGVKIKEEKKEKIKF